MHELELDENNKSENGLDPDVCDSDEIERLFVNSGFVVETEIAPKEYILHIDAKNGNTLNIAVGLSDNSCQLYALSDNQVAKILTLTEHTDKIIDCRFSSGDCNLLYTGSSDGTVKVWDVRTPNKSVINFRDTTVEDGSSNKSFNCFDISSNDRLLGVGTDLFAGDAFLLFWDTRNHKLLGGYWESHTDDITQVKFHPDEMNKLVSGSMDGLINIYDLSQTCEDDALVDSLNTGSSIEQLLWFSENGKDCISSIAHVPELQLWNMDDAEPHLRITRAEMAKEIKKEIEDYVFIVASHKAKNSLLTLVGSNFGDGECLRGLQIENRSIRPCCGFRENKQRVRSSWYNENTNILLTGGEKGILNVWTVNSSMYSFYTVKKKRS